MTARSLALWLLFSWGTGSSQIWDVPGNAEKRDKRAFLKGYHLIMSERIWLEKCIWKVTEVCDGFLLLWEGSPPFDSISCSAWLVSLDQDSVVSQYRKWLRGGMRSKPCWWAQWLQGTVIAGLSRQTQASFTPRHFAMLWAMKACITDIEEMRSPGKIADSSSVSI